MTEIIKLKDASYRKEVERKSKRDAILSMLQQNCEIKEIANKLGNIQKL